MPNLDPTHLQTLNLSPSELEHLSPDERQKRIRKQWLQLSLEFHPDKNPGDTSASERFKEITAAYEALKDRKESYQHEVNTHFDQEPIDIPDTAFDLLLQESIEEAYNTLMREYRELQTEGEKQAFATHYAPFINLAQTLEKKKEQLNVERAHYLYARENAALIDSITFEWRQLIIRLFAEEYLDDFQYRHALATGELSSILATRKLLSPVKLLAAIINSIIMVICHPMVHYFKIFMRELATEFSAVYNAEDLNLASISILAIKIIMVGGLITAPFYLAPTITLTLFSLPAIASLLELLACPVNQLIRPLAAYTELPVVALTALLSTLGAAAIYGLASLGGITSLITILPYLSVALSLYCVVGAIKLMAKMYELNPTIFFFQLTLLGINIVLSFIFPDPIDLNETFDILSTFLNNCTMTSMTFYANKFLDNVSAGMAEKIEILPLPEEPIDDSLKQATLLGHKKALQSHRFFNTPEQAEFITTEERTFWQQTSSFFGDGMKKQEDSSPDFSSATSETLAIDFVV